MDITSIIKKLDLSSVKMVVLRIFGGRKAVYEYIVDKANTAVNALLAANADRVQSIRGKMAEISGFAHKYVEWVPVGWLPYAERVNAAFDAVYRATADNVLSVEESKEITDKFYLAYSQFKAE